MICPECVANAAMVAAGVTTGGGVAGILATRFRSSTMRALKTTWWRFRLIVTMS